MTKFEKVDKWKKTGLLEGHDITPDQFEDLSDTFERCAVFMKENERYFSPMAKGMFLPLVRRTYPIFNKRKQEVDFLKLARFLNGRVFSGNGLIIQELESAWCHLDGDCEFACTIEQHIEDEDDFDIIPKDEH